LTLSMVLLALAMIGSNVLKGLDHTTDMAMLMFVFFN